MFFYQDTERLTKMFKVAIAVVLIAGFIGGIVFGQSMGKTTYVVNQSVEEILENPMAVNSSATKEFTFASAMGMLAIWIGSALTAMLLYSKWHQLQMLDDISGYLKRETEQENKAQKEPELTAEEN